ncbi:MAG: DotU family type IV/VI secretion system protein [Phycisphaerae bacterium]|nr:DotU family type IV/VI secretion system protein [Phycisphaerae bacterium]
MAATLLEICEPFLQYVCKLNRLARKRGTTDMGQVRAELKALLADCRARADREHLGSAYGEIELPLIYFADFMIKEGSLPWAGQWKDLAYEQGKMAGYSDFFDLLDETLADPRESAAQKLAVFYVGVGLGFTGMYLGQPEVLRRKMVEMSTRLRGTMDTDLAQRLSPDAYEHVDKRMLTIETAPKFVGMAIVLVLMVVGLVVANVYTYNSAMRDAQAVVKGLERASGQPGK